jgi:hypothetical protein
MAPGQGHSSHGPLTLRRLADDYMISPNASLPGHFARVCLRATLLPILSS